MAARERVYELDAEAVMTELLQMLLDHGYDVVEQVPAGVWWFKTEGDAASLARETGALFQRLVSDRLQEIEQY